MMRFFLFSALFARSLVNAVESKVELDYATYQGNQLQNGVSEWLGMRYAAPPTGDLRFAAPQDPSPMQGDQDATSHGARCIGLGQQPNRGLGEDCLFIDVFAPTRARENSSLPVYLFIQGGGFNTDSNSNYNGSGLLLASDQHMLVVTFNYRVGSLGFLASKEVHDGASVNNGLKDQRKAMQWVQNNIRKFGGDPDHVVIGGDSAGAASITLHLTAYGGRNDSLFHATAAESQSFGPVLTIEESQYQYDSLLKNSKCAGQSDTLACLRAMDLPAYQRAAVNIPYPGQSGEPLFMYNPVVDGDFIQAVTMKSFEDGKFLKLPAIYGDVRNEGTMFCPRKMANMETSDTWIKWQFPHLNTSHIKELERFFPREDTKFPRSTDFWRQCSNAYGNLRYNCPGVQLSNIYARESVPIWQYLWDVEDSRNEESGIGVFHTAEINAIWTPGNTGTKSFWPKSYLPGGDNSLIIPVVQGYWTSFIRSFNPNTYRAAGTPTWEEWSSEQTQRIVFRTNTTGMQTQSQHQKDACSYFASIAMDIKQ